MLLFGRWHQVLGAQAGEILSGPQDCNAFGLETEGGLVLFDAGAGFDQLAAQRALAEAGYRQGPSHLFLTHAHADHSGGAASLVSSYGTLLHAGALTAEWLASGDEDKISLPSAKAAGIYPAAFRLPLARADLIVRPGIAVRIADVVITPLATPGHSADHLSYLVHVDGSSVLVGGDAIFADGSVVLQDTWDCSVAETCRSIRRLAELEFDALLPGHGPCRLVNPGAAVATAMERINRLLPPLNFL